MTIPWGEFVVTASAFALVQVMLSAALGRSVPVRVAGALYLWELVAGTTLVMLGWSAMRVLAPTRSLLEVGASRQALLLLFGPAACSLFWPSEMFPTFELVVVWAALVPTWLIAGLVVFAVVRPGRRFGNAIPGWWLRLLGSSAVSVAMTAWIYRSQSKSPAGLVAAHVVVSSVACLLVLLPRRRRSRLPAGELAALAAAAIRSPTDPASRRRVGKSPSARAAILMFLPVFLAPLVSLPRGHGADEGPRDSGDVRAPARQSRPNLILVSLDTLRADHLGSYGYARDTSPHLDRLAAQGVQFDRFQASAPWTLPSHSALFSSRFPGMLPGYRIASGDPNLARWLQQEGYRTAAFTAGKFVDHRRFGDGFDEFHDMYEEEYFLGFTPVFLGSAFFVRRGLHRLGLKAVFLNGLNHWRDSKPGRISSLAGPQRSAAAASEWLRNNAHDEPFFLFYHTFGIHEYYLSTPELQEVADPWCPDYDGLLKGHGVRYGSRMRAEDVEYFVALYDAAIRITDQALGSLLGTIDALGIADRTLLVVTSDHGEGFRPDLGRSWHGRRLHDDLLHVPLILRFPGVLPAGERITELAGQLDLAPTILELLGVPPMPDMLGESMTPRFDGRSAADSHRVFFAETAQFGDIDESWAARRGPYKYIQYQSGAEELYHLESDAEEFSDLIAQSPAATEPLREDIRTYRSLCAGSTEMTDETWELLQELGYAVDRKP